jgi:hypothetical protein
LSSLVALASQDGFGVIGPLGNTIYMSPSMRNLTGFESRAMEGCVRPRRPRSDASFLTRSLHTRRACPRCTQRYVYEESIVHPDDRDRIALHLRAFATRKGPKVCSMEPARLRRLCKDGTWKRIEGGGVSDVRRVSRCARAVVRGTDV